MLHGCDWDVLWLQRDFGIYIANLFDTGQATRVLQHKQFGLASIMERYAGIKVTPCTQPVQGDVQSARGISKDSVQHNQP